MSFQKKYLKYKNKYKLLKTQHSGGGEDEKIKDEKKVLILCHPKIVTGSFEPLKLNNHFYGDINEEKKSLFEILFEKYKLSGTPTFETIDNNTFINEKGERFNNADHKMDAFNEEFINTHINKYDLVMVPDCDGIWFTLQSKIFYDKETRSFKSFTEEEQYKNLYTLIESCIKLTKILKINGIIQFSKLIFEGSCIIEGTKYESFIMAFKSYLDQNFFITEINDSNGLTSLIAQKTS